MSDRTDYQPNGFFYCKNPKRYMFWEENSNKKLAEFGIRNKLSCGGVWIKGKDFAFCVEYAADSYNHMAQIFGYDVQCEKWYGLAMHLAEYKHTLFTSKTRDDVLHDLGIII